MSKLPDTDEVVVIHYTGETYSLSYPSNYTGGAKGVVTFESYKEAADVIVRLTTVYAGHIYRETNREKPPNTTPAPALPN